MCSVYNAKNLISVKQNKIFPDGSITNNNNYNFRVGKSCSVQVRETQENQLKETAWLIK